MESETDESSHEIPRNHPNPSTQVVHPNSPWLRLRGGKPTAYKHRQPTQDASVAGSGVSGGWERAASIVLITMVVLVGVAYSLQAGLSFWWDEIYTVENFVDVGTVEAWSTEYHSNNHILFTILARWSSSTFGTNEVAYRLPSIGFAIAGYALLLAKVRRYVGSVEAIAAGTVMLASPLLLYWVPQARGYGLTIFAAAVVLGGTLALASGRDGWVPYAQIAAGGFMGIATLPHFAIPFTILCVVLAGVRRNQWRRTVVAWGAVALANILFYLPSGLLSNAVGRTGASSNPKLSLVDVIRGPFRFQIVGTLSGAGDIRALVSDVWVPVIVTVLVLASLLAVLRAYLDHIWWPLVLAAIPVFGTYAVAVVRGYQVTDRNLLFLLPFMALLFALGFGYVARRGAGPALLLWLRRVPMLVAVPVLAFLVMQTAVDWSRVPIENFRGGAILAEESGADVIVTDSRYATGFLHYLPEVEAYGEDKLIAAVCGDERSFAYIAHSHRRGFDSPTECLEARDASRVDVPQRRRGNIVVWFVPRIEEG